MASKVTTLRTGLDWWEALMCLVAGGMGLLTSNSGGVAILCALTTGIAFGVWRAVRFLAKLLEYAQARHETTPEQ